MDRRSALGTIGGLAALAVSGESQLVFAYINCAYTHPLPIGAVASVRRHLDRRSKPDADLPPEPADVERLLEALA